MIQNATTNNLVGTVAMFNAIDPEGIEGLWVTDGTATGTVELEPIVGANIGGINPQFLLSFNGEMLFNGTDAGGNRGLWTTDGTAAGTHELTGISGANPTGLDPGYLQYYNGTVLFRGEAGVAGDDVPGLWVTNGTVAGTMEIGGSANIGISGIYGEGLLPSNPDFTPLNGKVLFRGEDANAQVGLWATDGTAAGTVELAPIGGAAFASAFSSTPQRDIQPQYMTILANKVLFDGADQQDTPGSLWVTDGTAAGTFEIGGQGNAGVAGSPNGFTNQFTSELPLGIQPNDLTTFNSKVVFAGFDSTLKPNGFYADTDALWTTDGTAAGTTEIGELGNAGIIGINPAVQGGIFWNGSIEHPDFTVYNGKVLFVGYDASNHVGLWETDGTAAGTVEIGGQGNASIAGGLSLLDSQSPNFTVVNGEVLFNGFNSNNQAGLWVTDGTAAGTHEIVALPDLGVNDLTLFSAPEAAVSSIGISGIGITNGNGDLNAGKAVAFEVNMSEAVTVAGGSPTLSLNDGATASFDAARSTSTALFFDYTIAIGQNTSDLAVSSLNLNGATIHDGAGNIADLSGAINYNPAGILQVDTHTAAAPLLPLQGLTTGEQQVEAMYVAYFGRAGDAAGTYFWMGNLDAGQPVDNVAANFAPQVESEAIYPLLASPNTDSESARVAFIDSIYQNLFNRGPDAPGLAYWDNELHNDQLTLSGAALSAAFGGFILEVIRGAQNSSAGQDITTIENKVAVASYFTEQLAIHNVNYAGNLPTTVDAQAHSVVAATNSTAASVAAEKAAIDADVVSDLAAQNAAATAIVGIAGSQATH